MDFLEYLVFGGLESGLRSFGLRDWLPEFISKVLLEWIGGFRALGAVWG